MIAGLMRKRRLVLSVLGFAACLGVAAGRPAVNPRIERVEKGLRPPVLVEGDPVWTLAERMRFHKVHGVSIAVIKEFKVEWAAGYGVADAETKKPVTASTLFQAASISKPVSAMGALALVQAGKLPLDRDVNTVLKSWKVPENAHTKKAPVTLEGLLSHTAGLTVHGFPGYEAGSPVPTIVQVLDGTPPANTAPIRVDLDPGTRYRYSGGGYTIAQLAMTDVTGQPFPALLAEKVLRPIGMTSSTFEQPLPAARVADAAAGYRADGAPLPGKRHVYPEMAAAGLWTTPTDLARFALAVQKILRDEKGPLSKATAENMLRPRRDGYGLGLGIEEKGGATYFTHGGSNEGFQALLYADESRGYGAVIMTNSDAGFRLIPEILRAIAAEYNWEGYEKAPIPLAKLSPEELALYAGRYKLGPDSVISFQPREGGLAASVPLEGGFEILPISRTAFVRRDEETRYFFGRRADGGAELRIKEGSTSRVGPRISPGTRVPAEDLEAGRVEDALAGYQKLRAADPADPAVAEARLNQLGYGLLERKEPAKAVAVLQLNTQLYPDSANTWDSLAEATEAAGDAAGAVALYRKALQLSAPGGSSGSAVGDERVRAHAAARLKALGVEP
jgi:CubicO group peptidase (beta-lactamase class C family)